MDKYKPEDPSSFFSTYHDILCLSLDREISHDSEITNLRARVAMHSIDNKQSEFPCFPARFYPAPDYP